MWDLHKIEKAFAEAAVDPDRWSDALQCISAETESLGTILLPVTGRSLPNTPVSEALAKATETYFRDGWHLRDLRYNVSIPKFVSTGLIEDFDCISPDDIGRSPYYQEFLAAVGLRWFDGVCMRAGDDIWCV
jgi:hypothetical protein